MTRPFSEFYEIVAARSLQFGKETRPSTHYRPKSTARTVGRNLAYWTRGRKAHWSTGRTAAYLAAYVEFARAARFPATGIEANDGYVWLDRAVMCSLLAGRCVRYRTSDATFGLTEKGKALIAPFAPLTRYEGAAF